MDRQILDSFSDYVDLLLDAICAVDKDSTVLYVSKGAQRVFGYTPEEMIGKKMLDLLHPEDAEITHQSIHTVMQDKQVVDFENRYIRKDGEIVHLLWSTSWSEHHQMRLGVARDITRIKQAEAMQKSLLAISEAVHRSQGIKQISQKVFTQLGALLPLAAFGIIIKKQGEDSWQTLFESVGGCFSNSHNDVMTRAIKTNQHMVEALDDSLTLVVPFKVDEGGFGVLLLILADNSFELSEDDQSLLSFTAEQIGTSIEREQMLERLQYLALYDTLTGLPNRDLFQDRVQSALLRARREKSQFALLYLDLDKFKEANDVFGHAAGDFLLKEVAQRIQGCVRDTDTVVRFGGDEFVVLLDSIENVAAAFAVAEKIRLVVVHPYAWQSQKIELSISIGVAVFPTHGEEVTQLISAADEAMYRAKKSGKNCVA